jgi:uncharacterized protein
MFNLGDRTFTTVPRYFSRDDTDLLLSRIAEYLAGGSEPFLIAIHGGEPTLWPEDHFEHFAQGVERLRRDGLDLQVSLQSNLYSPLSRPLRTFLRRLDVRIGISLDGPASWNDAHRVNHAGRGSSQRVLRNLARLVDEGDSDLIGGFLCVANPDIPPGDFLGWLDALPVRRADILWPIEYSYDRPPWADAGRSAYARSPRYGRWMAELFEAWWERDDPELYIRSFAYCVEALLGGRRHTDAFVNDTLDMFVVNTDGRVEYPDYLRGTAAGSRATGLHLGSHSIAQVEAHPVFRRLLSLHESLPESCRGCRHETICGGGFLAGRTSRDRLICDGPSVLCPDQMWFFDTVDRLVRGAAVAAGYPGEARDPASPCPVLTRSSPVSGPAAAP